ncbi:MAG: ADP-ribosylglycohydrolase family protein [Clostridia bacterium]|nr:ADP-ribosylglycohydrolase family protein [Clostridia bacterium]
MTKEAITRNALIGQAVGDAFGVPVEFLPRSTVRAINLLEMTGADSEEPPDSRWGTIIPKGSWSDDTSMTVASMASFVSCGGPDYEDQMRQFTRWWDGGAYCCLAYPFGLGGNISAAMARFRRGVPALECGGRQIMDNGNGALMRILPFSLYCIFRELGPEETVTVSGNGSAITHGHEISRLCCFVWTEFLRALLSGRNVGGAIAAIEDLPYQRWFSETATSAVSFVTEGKIRDLRQADIGETGYVVDSLYAALYSMIRGHDYESTIRTAVSLGYDTDTNAAITGTAAGILYGIEDIPARWLSVLRGRPLLDDTAQRFAACFA